ncbi:MAG TPA: peptidoglycan DD-metalloendopeptidase family protein [Acidimicrobiales bacterium]|nr:peptidoglycan DD-metalloendopeptidase family protein [Acidimicrobiales bacterium]
MATGTEIEPAQAQPNEGSGSTTTTAPPGPDPEVPAPPGDAEQDSPKEPVPTQQVVIPPPPVEAAPGPPTPEVQQRAQATLAARQRTFDRMFSLRAGESRRFESLLGETAVLEGRFAAMDADRRLQQDRLLEAKERLKRLAVARYMATPVASLNHALEAPDFVDMSRRLAMLGAAENADRGRVEEYVEASRNSTTELDRVKGDLDRKRAELDAARVALEKADAVLLSGKAQLVSSEMGGLVVAGGLAFPVAGPHNFTDSFGAPRMTGTAFAHLHEGTDVFAPNGTPLVAIERGVLISVGSDVLGGTKLWLVGATGTRYYYAHLSAFAPGVADGKAVQAGEVIGFVGSTGNAQGTSPHLHFEAHPDGGAAINPYPLLRIIDAAARAVPGPQKP